MASEFRKRLAEVRNEKGLTQAAVEKRAGFAPGTVSHYESGDRAPGIENLCLLCAALGCKAKDLLGI